MGYECDYCSKKVSVGNAIARRGKAKYLGGVGRKTTGITRRKFKPNLQNIKVVIDGAIKHARVCVKCIRSGIAKRPIVNKPFTVKV